MIKPRTGAVKASIAEKSNVVMDYFGCGCDKHDGGSPDIELVIHNTVEHVRSVLEAAGVPLSETQNNILAPHFTKKVDQ